MKLTRSVAAYVVGALLVATTVTGVIGDASANAEAPPGPPDESVVYWDRVGVQAVSAAGYPAPDGYTVLAYVGVAVYDSVMAIEGGFEPFAVDADAPEGTSAEAAVAAAAHAVLAHYLPAQAGIIDTAYTAALEDIDDGQAKTDGLALGEAVAAAWIGMRSDDGFRAPATYTPPNPPVPGAWIPTATSPPISVSLGDVRPFSLRVGDQFRPSGPPKLGSKQWAADYNEVKQIGSSTSTTRTPEQTVAARFWAENPVVQARASFRRFVTDHQLDVGDAARFMAMASVTYADSLIACFDAKYHDAFWRPVTAIRAGDTDSNPATVGDPAWATLLPGTPNHPEYPSAHSCITPSGARVVAAFLGTDQIDFTVPSVSNPSLGDRTFATVADLEYEVSNARIWGGIHYRTSVEDGVKLGSKVTNWVLAHEFRPVNG